MNETERLLRILRHMEADRIPVTGFLVSVIQGLMDHMGVRLPEAHHEPGLMAKLAAASHEILGLESVKLPFDMTVEAGLLGAEIDYGTMTTLPQIKAHPYRDPGEFVVPEGFCSKGRVPVVLEAIRIAQREYGHRIPVISSIVGPLTLSGMLYGVDTILFWMLAEPEQYVSVLRKATQFCIAYGQEHFRAGSDVVQIADPVSSGDLISSDQYGKYVFPYHQEFCKAFHEPIVMHICGNITGHIPFLAEMGMNGISFDEKTDIGEMVKYLKGKVALIGYVSTTLLSNGNADEVYENATECLRAGVDVLNSGCAWPLGTPVGNIKAMIRAAADSVHHP